MAKRGQAGQALHLCTAASVCGGIVSSVALLLFTRPICVVFMLLIAISLAWPLISAQIKKLRTRKAP